MSLRSASCNASRTAGFTLVEALAALAVLAAGLAAIGELGASSLRANRQAQQHIAQIAVTRQIIAGMPNRNALAFGRMTGLLRDHQWRIDAVPVSTAFAGSSESWKPQGIVLLVKSPAGSTIEVDTIRLRKESKQ